MGRPKVYKEGRYQLLINISTQTRDFFEKYNINRTEWVEDRVSAELDIKKYKIEELKRKVETSRALLKQQEATLEQLILEDTRDKEIKFNVQVNAGYEAYYLKKLFLQGKIRVLEVDYLEQVNKLKELDPYFEISSNGEVKLKLPWKEIPWEIKDVFRKVGMGGDGKYQIKPTYITMSGVTDSFSFDREKLGQKTKLGEITKDTSIEDFNQFNPKIEGETLRTQIKEEYRDLIEIEKSPHIDVEVIR
jgi:hypothetical protein